MGVRIVTEDKTTVMYDSVTCWGFGPIFEGYDSEEQCEAFLTWLRDEHGLDARQPSDKEMDGLLAEWRAVALDEDGDLIVTDA